MGRDPSYSDDEMLEGIPLTPDDIGWILEGNTRRILRKEEDLRHLLRRVLATTVELRNLRMNFDSEIRRRVDMHASSTGLAGTLSPQAAAKFLSPEQLTALFDTFSQQRLKILEGQREAARMEAEQWRKGRKATMQALDDMILSLKELTPETAPDSEEAADAGGKLEEMVKEMQSVRDWLGNLPTGEDPDTTRTGLEQR